MGPSPIFDAETQGRRDSLLIKENSASLRLCVKRLIYFLALLAVACKPGLPTKSTLTYPPARKSDTVDDYHGTKVADPYRWMEALDSKEVADWVAASNAVNEPHLKALTLREH